MALSLRIARERHAALATVALGALAGFVYLSARVNSRAAENLDRRVLRAVKRRRREPLDSLVRDVTSLGGVPLVGLAHAGAAIALRNSPVALVQLALGALGGGAADVALKRHFQRPRPTVIRPLAYVTSSSYPSGHSIASSSLYLTLAFAATRHAPPVHRAFAIGAAGTLAACVAATRVYLGVHHPTDVLAGLAIGTAWACLLEAAFESRGAYRVEAAVAEAPDVVGAAIDALAEEGALDVHEGDVETHAERVTELVHE